VKARWDASKGRQRGQGQWEVGLSTLTQSSRCKCQYRAKERQLFDSLSLFTSYDAFSVRLCPSGQCA